MVVTVSYQPIIFNIFAQTILKFAVGKIPLTIYSSYFNNYFQQFLSEGMFGGVMFTGVITRAELDAMDYVLAAVVLEIILFNAFIVIAKHIRAVIIRKLS